MSPVSSDQADAAAETILALINSRPHSPTKAEIAALVELAIGGLYMNEAAAATQIKQDLATSVLQSHGRNERQWSPDETAVLKARTIDAAVAKIAKVVGRTTYFVPVSHK